MKIAVFADLHLTDNFNTVKSTVLDWALNEVRRRKVDLICLIGDLTAQGTGRQSERILELFRKNGIPFCSTPGNAELRVGGIEAEKQFDIPPPESAKLILVNTARNEPAEPELARVAALPHGVGFLLATHNPVRNWSETARKTVSDAMKCGAVSAVIAGHSHHDEPEILRGLDPDKASGGPPMFSLMSDDSGSWLRQDCVMPGVDPFEWNAEKRAALRDRFGISDMWEPLECLDFAVRNRIPHVELRSMLEYSDALNDAVARWREQGGKTLSLHLPNLTPDDDGGALRQSAELAVRLGCDRVTLHVPKVTASGYPAAKDRLLSRFGTELAVLQENKLTIGIENLHTTPEARTDDLRNFGCTIAECREWIELLRKEFSTNRIGFHMDIGHARNNAPFSARENLSDWYCELGCMVNGWHFHQVTQENGGFRNHKNLSGFYEKLISLGGWLMADRAGQLTDAPVFLEIRTFAGCRESWLRLTEILKAIQLTRFPVAGKRGHSS